MPHSVETGTEAKGPGVLGCESPWQWWMHNEDAMATDKLAEGIRNFAADTRSQDGPTGCWFGNSMPVREGGSMHNQAAEEIIDELWGEHSPGAMAEIGGLGVARWFVCRCNRASAAGHPR